MIVVDVSITIILKINLYGVYVVRIAAVLTVFTNCSNEHFGTFIEIHLPCYHRMGSCYGHYKCIFQCRDRLHTSKSDVYRRQILKYKDGAALKGLLTD